CNYTDNFALASKYLIRAYIISKKRNDANSMSVTMGIMAKNYDDQKKVDSAIICYDAAKKLFREADNLSGYAIACNNLGQIYNRQKRSKERYQAFQEAINVSRTLGDFENVAAFESN